MKQFLPQFQRLSEPNGEVIRFGVANWIIRSALLVFVIGSFAGVTSRSFGSDFSRRWTGSVVLAQQPTSSPADASLKDDPRVRRWRHTILWSAIILVIFVTASIAIIVFSRRWRQWIKGAARHDEPTQDGDVWAMHKSPDIEDAGGDETRE